MLALSLERLTPDQLSAWLDNGKRVWDAKKHRWIVVAPVAGLLAVLPQQQAAPQPSNSLQRFTPQLTAVGECMSKDDGFECKQVRTGDPNNIDVKYSAVEALPYADMWRVHQRALEAQGLQAPGEGPAAPPLVTDRPRYLSFVWHIEATDGSLDLFNQCILPRIHQQVITAAATFLVKMGSTPANQPAAAAAAPSAPGYAHGLAAVGQPIEGVAPVLQLRQSAGREGSPWAGRGGQPQAGDLALRLQSALNTAFGSHAAPPSAPAALAPLPLDQGAAAAVAHAPGSTSCRSGMGAPSGGTPGHAAAVRGLQDANLQARGSEKVGGSRSMARLFRFNGQPSRLQQQGSSSAANATQLHAPRPSNNTHQQRARGLQYFGGAMSRSSASSNSTQVAGGAATAPQEQHWQAACSDVGVDRPHHQAPQEMQLQLRSAPVPPQGPAPAAAGRSLQRQGLLQQPAAAAAGGSHPAVQDLGHPGVLPQSVSAAGQQQDTAVQSPALHNFPLLAQGVEQSQLLFKRLLEAEQARAVASEGGLDVPQQQQRGAAAAGGSAGSALLGLEGYWGYPTSSAAPSAGLVHGTGSAGSQPQQHQGVQLGLSGHQGTESFQDAAAGAVNAGYLPAQQVRAHKYGVSSDQHHHNHQQQEQQEEEEEGYQQQLLPTSTEGLQYGEGSFGAHMSHSAQVQYLLTQTEDVPPLGLSAASHGVGLGQQGQPSVRTESRGPEAVHTGHGDQHSLAAGGAGYAGPPPGTPPVPGGVPIPALQPGSASPVRSYQYLELDAQRGAAAFQLPTAAAAGGADAGGSSRSSSALAGAVGAGSSNWLPPAAAPAAAGMDAGHHEGADTGAQPVPQPTVENSLSALSLQGGNQDQLQGPSGLAQGGAGWPPSQQQAAHSTPAAGGAGAAAASSLLAEPAAAAAAVGGPALAAGGVARHRKRCRAFADDQPEAAAAAAAAMAAAPPFSAAPQEEDKMDAEGGPTPAKRTRLRLRAARAPTQHQQQHEVVQPGPHDEHQPSASASEDDDEEEHCRQLRRQHLQQQSCLEGDQEHLEQLDSAEQQLQQQAGEEPVIAEVAVQPPAVAQDLAAQAQVLAAEAWGPLVGLPDEEERAAHAPPLTREEQWAAADAELKLWKLAAWAEEGLTEDEAVELLGLLFAKEQLLKGTAPSWDYWLRASTQEVGAILCCVPADPEDPDTVKLPEFPPKGKGYATLAQWPVRMEAAFNAALKAAQEGAPLEGECFKVSRMLVEVTTAGEESGGCGRVLRSVSHPELLVKLGGEDTTLRAFLLETDILAACQDNGCCHVITWRGLAYSTKGNIGFAMLRAPYTLTRIQLPFTLGLLKRVGFHTLCGLYEIHQVGYLHRDVKQMNMVGWEAGGGGGAENALPTVQLIDCGAGKKLALHETKCPVTGVGTSSFMAPELVLPQDYPQVSTANLPKLDVWSCGVVIASIGMWRSFTQVTLFSHTDLLAALRRGAVQLVEQHQQQQQQDGKQHQQQQDGKQQQQQLSKRALRYALGYARAPAGSLVTIEEAHTLLRSLGVSRVLDACSELADSVGPLGMHLLKGMLAPDPNQRFSVLQAFWHPFFTGDRQHLLAQPGGAGNSKPLQQLVQQAKDRGRCPHANYLGSCMQCLDEEHPG